MSAKNKARFNGIDLLIIIILFGAIAGIVMRYQLVDFIKSSNGDTQAQVSFLVQDIKETSYDYFVEGDEFFLTSTDNKLGELIQAPQALPAEVFEQDLLGNYVKSSSEAGRIDLRGVLLSQGDFTDEGYLLNSTKYIAPGSELSIYSGKIEINVIITDIVPVE